MTERDRDEQFLRRWSRRKIDGEAIDETPPDADLPDESVEIAPDGDVESEDFDAEVVADLPDIETLDKDSDYTGFLRDGVPEKLKKLALRKLWLSDPVLANLDGLNDYDEDFGAILKTGAEYMQRLADAGEKFTRPGAAETRRRWSRNQRNWWRMPKSRMPIPALSGMVPPTAPTLRTVCRLTPRTRSAAELPPRSGSGRPIGFCDHRITESC